MVTNPIYDGQSETYETIADPPIRPMNLPSIPPPTPTSARPFLSSTSPSTPNSAYPLLGHAHQTPVGIDPAYAYPPPHPLSFPPSCIDDGYTTMTSAGGLHEKVNLNSGQDDASLDKVVQEEVRYVLDEHSYKTV